MSFQIDVKRFYIPEKFIVHCPKCGYPCFVPDGHLSYPIANEVFNYTVYCPNEWKDENDEWNDCSHEWEVPVRLNVSFELITEESSKNHNDSETMMFAEAGRRHDDMQ